MLFGSPKSLYIVVLSPNRYGMYMALTREKYLIPSDEWCSNKLALQQDSLAF